MWKKSPLESQAMRPSFQGLLLFLGSLSLHRCSSYCLGTSLHVLFNQGECYSHISSGIPLGPRPALDRHSISCSYRPSLSLSLQTHWVWRPGFLHILLSVASKQWILPLTMTSKTFSTGNSGHCISLYQTQVYRRDAELGERVAMSWAQIYLLA